MYNKFSIFDIRLTVRIVAAGLEEISARLNLMVKAELAELVAGAPMSPGDPETRCQYLEKLLGKHGQRILKPIHVHAHKFSRWPLDLSTTCCSVSYCSSHKKLM